MCNKNCVVQKVSTLVVYTLDVLRELFSTEPSVCPPCNLPLQKPDENTELTFF